MNNWKTTIAFGLAGIATLVGQIFPDYAEIANGVAGLATMIGGKLAADAKPT